MGTQRKVRFEIDISFPERGREKLAEYVDRMDKHFLNVEHRHKIIRFLEGIEGLKYYRRMGGENNLVYLNDPAIIMLLIETFPGIVASVTGPINEEHQAVFDQQRNVVMRKSLFYDQFRYQIKFKSTPEFVKNCQDQLAEILLGKDPVTWRAHRLFTKFDDGKSGPLPWTLGMPTRRVYRGHPSPLRSHFRPQNVILYLQHDQDFIHIKLMANEYIDSFQEIMLFDELN